ncbi:glycoside hydrolase family 10 protein [Salinimicrobium sp. GXAS 041]|uniref:glycoside hydrolase family 10 protein n=1 Tax=Salinimicrobium sp. GXAS 041 TaxID=3400806 RepID=UPI003C779717
MSKKPAYLFFVLVFLLFNSCTSSRPVVENNDEETPAVVEERKEEVPEVIPEDVEPVPVAKKETRNFPTANREFRAAWIATVANINWPSKPGLTSKQQQQEAIALLDLLKENNFNAVIFQVRPQTDALYQSEIEPWSYFLTGTQGQAPEPFYDPLHFWIEAAHDRGLELHAWLNPYRAHHTTGKEITGHSIVKTKPELVVKLQDGQYWMDPSLEGTKKHSTAVVMDLVKRYNLDGIHFDDYFYPYDSYNGGEDFPDHQSWAAYQSGGGELSRGDWRRKSVNDFIQNLYKQIKAEKPHVKFGLSPFGIWRPGYPESIAGYDQYDKLYADAKLWLNKGWIDYFTPQLYWTINKSAQSFPVLLGWWESENIQKRHLWPGINVGLGGDEKNIDETINQIMITRGMLPKSPGVVHWSIGPLVKYPNLIKAIAEGPYRKEALVPESPWLDAIVPAAPVVVPERISDKINITWVPGDEEEIFKWVVYLKRGDSWTYDILDRNATSVEVVRTEKNPVTAVAVTAVDRTGNESEFKEVKIK